MFSCCKLVCPPIAVILASIYHTAGHSKQKQNYHHNLEKSTSGLFMISTLERKIWKEVNFYGNGCFPWCIRLPAIQWNDVFQITLFQEYNDLSLNMKCSHWFLYSTWFNLRFVNFKGESVDNQSLIRISTNFHKVVDNFPIHCFCN